MPKSALVVGGSGFAGSHLVAALLEAGYRVESTYCRARFSTDLGLGFESAQFEKAGQLRYTQLDLLSSLKPLYQSLSENKPDFVFLLAAVSYVPEAERDFLRTLSLNVAPLHSLCRAILDQASASRIVFVSSSEVYGAAATNNQALSESSPLQSTNSYSLSKKLSEEVLDFFRSQHNIDCCVVRPFNHIGKGQSERFVTSSFAKQLAEIKSVGARGTLKVGSLQAMRDFSSVKDMVRGYILAAESGLYGPFNLCSGRATSISEVLQTLINIADINPEILVDPSRVRANEIKSFCGSYEKASAELGWKPEIPLEQALGELYEYWLARVIAAKSSASSLGSGA